MDLDKKIKAIINKNAREELFEKNPEGGITLSPKGIELYSLKFDKVYKVTRKERRNLLSQNTGNAKANKESLLDLNNRLWRKRKRVNEDPENDNSEGDNPDIHRDLAWLFYSSYCVPKPDSFLIYANEITWNMRKEDPKTPRLIFKYDNDDRTVGVEVATLVKRNVIHWNPSKLEENSRTSFNEAFYRKMREKQFRILEKLIDKKAWVLEDGWDVECDEKLLILISNSMGEGKAGLAYKVVLQEYVNYLCKDTVFDRILIA